MSPAVIPDLPHKKYFQNSIGFTISNQPGSGTFCCKVVWIVSQRYGKTVGKDVPISTAHVVKAVSAPFRWTCNIFTFCKYNSISVYFPQCRNCYDISKIFVLHVRQSNISLINKISIHFYLNLLYRNFIRIRTTSSRARSLLLLNSQLQLLR